MQNKVRVGIRGAAGLLGSRVGAAIAHTQDMSLEVGVVLPDDTLRSVIDRYQILNGRGQNLPKRMFVQSSNRFGRESDAVRGLNSAQNLIHFEGASQLSWRKTCDVIIDTAYPAGKETFAEQYHNFPGIILLQDGASPEGRLIVPPLIAPPTENAPTNVYRMGDCILSGLVPLLYPFRDMAAGIRIHMLTQFDGKEPYYLIAERANAFYIRDDLRDKVQQELGILFPKQEIHVAAVIQIPSILHYQATIELELQSTISHEELKQLLGKMPRLCLLPASVVSTYDVNLARSFSDTVPPVMVFESALCPQTEKRSKNVRILAALYYRTTAVLPNIDAIRMLALGMDPIEAMKQTDKDMNFSKEVGNA